MPRALMTSIFEGQTLKTRPFPSKTRVISVLGIHIYNIYIHYIMYIKNPTINSKGLQCRCKGTYFGHFWRTLIAVFLILPHMIADFLDTQTACRMFWTPWSLKLQVITRYHWPCQQLGFWCSPPFPRAPLLCLCFFLTPCHFLPKNRTKMV